VSMGSRLSEGEPEMPWYFYGLEFVSGLFLLTTSHVLFRA
jgi:hypothetical protein